MKRADNESFLSKVRTEAMINGCLRSWPLLVICLLMALIGKKVASI